MRSSRVLSSLLVILLIPASTVCAQQVYNGCAKNNNGQLRIVLPGEACLPSEHPVQWTSGGTTPTVVPPSTPGPLRVLDQNANAVGVLVTPGAAAKQFGDLWVSLPVSSNGFQLATTFYTYYQTTACDGDAYLPVEATTLLRAGYVLSGSTGPAVSYAGPTQVDRTAIQAYGRYVNGTFTCTPYTPPMSMALFGKVVSVDVSSFVAPFKVVQ